MSPAAMQRYLAREVVLARSNYDVQIARIRDARKAGTLDGARDVNMHTLHSHRTVMLAAEVKP